MKIKYTTKNQRMSIEIENDSIKDSFKHLAEFQEVFDQESCGLCQGEDLQMVVRTVENNDYYEIKCKSCTAKLAFGQHKAGGSLFPKRKRVDGGYDLEGQGWHKWNGNTALTL